MKLAEKINDRLQEAKALSIGIFWFDFVKNKLFYFSDKIKNVSTIDNKYISALGHKKYWEIIKEETSAAEKDYKYLPRGRVSIEEKRSGKYATVSMSGAILFDNDVKFQILTYFGLDKNKTEFNDEQY